MRDQAPHIRRFWGRVRSTAQTCEYGPDPLDDQAREIALIRFCLDEIERLHREAKSPPLRHIEWTTYVEQEAP